MDFTSTQTVEYINILGEAIDFCREKVSSSSIIQNQTFEYAIILLYSRLLLTMCEIYTLLLNGYPEGAMSLWRNTYENIVITNYLFKNKCDKDLIERFFDSIDVSAWIEDRKTLEWCSKNYPDNSEVQQKLKYVENELKKYAVKYPEYCDVSKLKFSDYWWVRKGCSFTDLSHKTDFSKNYVYNIASSKLHASLFSSVFYIDNTEEGILIGETEKGLEIPLHYSALNLIVATMMINDVFPCLGLSQIIDKLKKLCDEVKIISV